MTNDLPRYLTQTEAARFLRTSPQTLLAWERQGLIRARRPNKKKRRGGGLVLYVTLELIAFVENSEVSSQQPLERRGRPRKLEGSANAERFI